MRKVYINKIHIALEIVGYIMVLMSLAYSIVVMYTTDGQIPTHYDMNGEIDAYGSPATLLILPICMLVTGVIMSLCLHLVPTTKWNTGFKLNPGKEVIVFTDFGYMISSMITSMGAFSMAATFFFDKGANAVLISSGALVGLMILETVVFFVKAYRDNMD